MRAERARRRRITSDPRARDALDEDLRGAVRQPDDLHEPSDDADAIQVAGRGILEIRVSLRDEQDDVAVIRGRVDGRERLRAADEQRHDDVGKHHDVAEREHRKPVRNLEPLGVASQDQRHARNLPRFLIDEQPLVAGWEC